MPTNTNNNNPLPETSLYFLLGCVATTSSLMSSTRSHSITSIDHHHRLHRETAHDYIIVIVVLITVPVMNVDVGLVELVVFIMMKIHFAVLV